MSEETDLRDIRIAKLAFLGTSIVTVGDGIATLAAGLALDALEQDFHENYHVRHAPNVGEALRQLDYYINELVKIKSTLT